ncbi:protein mono-ADP-ribosyltransferase PARP12-like isoform X2 [Anolis sagrei]|uniref:protein mono-ADP-ribosyltransferase PARP12-like isoform X2 n=1 Tax=Anolis sagrei TaxID=38937 RepID=UPI003520ADF1
MSDPAVCSFLTKVLCAHGGGAELGSLPGEVGLPEAQLKEVLGEAGPERYLSLSRGGCTWVLALTAARLCVRQVCARQDCERLHLCKQNLMGRCRARACKYSHDILSEDNRKVLKNHELSGLNENELRVLLLQNDPFLIPDVCNAYNKGEASCNQQDNCSKLHICRYFLKGQCRFPRCKRSHCLMDPKALKLLLAEGVDNEMAFNIQTICNYKTNALARELGANKYTSSKLRPTANQEKSGNQSKSIFEQTSGLNTFMNIDPNQGISSKPSPIANQEKSGNQSKSVLEQTSSLNTFMNIDPNQDTSSKLRPTANQERSGYQIKSILKQTSGLNTFMNIDPNQGISSKPSPIAIQEKSGNQSKSVLEQTSSLNTFMNIDSNQGISSKPRPIANQETSGNQSKSVLEQTSSLNSFMNINPNQDTSSKLRPTANQEKSGYPIKSILKQTSGLNAFMNIDPNQDVKTAHCPKPLPNAEKEKIDEICLYYLFQFCKHKNNCNMFHYHLPYRWQVDSGNGWNDLPNGGEIEKAYCDPSLTSVLDLGIDFGTMTSSTGPIRRLSTPSSVTKPAKFVMTTKWLWYWKNDKGQWIEYGKQDGKAQGSSICSDDLENVFLADPKGSIQFQADTQLYVISFKDMTQRNVLYQTRREVRRRPKFVSSEDVKTKKGHTAHSAPMSATIPPPSPNYPSHWDKSALPSIGFKAIELTKGLPEYIKIETVFQKTMDNYVIQRITRIQNPSLWEIFQWQKDQMKKKNGGQDVDERLLFHGTNTNNIKAICNDNFDWRICGTNGTVFGKGSYFARDARYSHNYCQRDEKIKVMFVAQVLVGNFVVGNANYSRPPAKSIGMLQYYDSCVDKMMDPSIFVIFEKHQIYPAYMIYYSEEEKKCILS